MGLSKELIMQFVKVTNDGSQKARETTAFGTIALCDDGSLGVKIDGSDLVTPLAMSDVAAAAEGDDGNVTMRSTSDIQDGDRVTVQIKNHSVVVTGNLTAPSARTQEVRQIVVDVSEKVSVDQLAAEQARISELETDNVKVKERITAAEAHIDDIEANTLSVDEADAKYASIEELDATKANIEGLDVKFANIDFSNIGEAAMTHLYATSGLIDNVTIGNGTISGYLVGVTIKGDLIEANTLVADKLVIKGEDGLYYKLNTDGVTTEAEQTDYNSLNGSIITAKSITATKIAVDDLVAFDATIGGFIIDENSIHSEVKDDEGNTVRGIYMDSEGQINFGDESNFIKYYKDEDGTYKLAISAASILYALNGKQYSLSDLGAIGEYVHIGTYEDEPCIELGETDSDFRLIITNTRIMFMEGTSVPAYINNQALHITKAVIEEEIQQGEFVWKVRQNGNMGLMWKGDV
jgi:hypothetical protein